MSDHQYPPLKKAPNLFNFEELLCLAKKNPEKFELRRHEYIESFLTRLPANKQQRMRGLQWRIDQMRQLTHSPMGACLNMMNMMWDSLHNLNEQQQALSPAPKTVKTETTTTAQIIPFSGPPAPEASR
jgi:Protein of unknown function (DUF3135)